MRGETRLTLFWAEAIIALLVLGLVAIAGLTALATREQTISNETNSLARLSLILAESTQRIVFDADLALSSLEEKVEHAGVRSPDAFRRFAATPEIHGLLQERIVQTADVDTLAFIDANGIVINTSRSWPPDGVSVSDREYFNTLRDSPPASYAISAPLENRLTGHSVIILARRISAPDGSFLGLAIATIATSRFEKLFAAVLPGNGASVSLYRRDGVLLIQLPLSDETSIKEQSPAIQRFFNETIAREEQGTLRTKISLDAEATPQLLAMQTVRGYPLVVNTKHLENIVLAGWWKLARLIFAFAAAAVILLTLLGFAIFRHWEMQARVAETATQLVRANAGLAAANQELEAFSYSVSHDLRAPLRGIDGWSLALQEDYGAVLDAQGRQYLGIVRAEAQRMGQLIEDLLQLSRVARGELVRTPVDVSALAQSVARRLTDAIPDRRIEFVIAPGLAADADARLLEIALTNLFDNACKFTTMRDPARIEFGRGASPDPVTKAVTQAYFVGDNGVGFDLAHAAKLFGAFQRLHAASEFPGTGIGLATVQRIVRRHGGHIWAEAQPDQGACFYFTLGEGA